MAELEAIPHRTGLPIDAVERLRQALDSAAVDLPSEQVAAAREEHHVDVDEVGRLVERRQAQAQQALAAAHVDQVDDPVVLGVVRVH